MSILRTSLVAAALVLANGYSTSASAACTGSGVNLTCATQQDAYQTLLSLAGGIAVPESTITSLVDNAKAAYQWLYSYNVSSAKDVAWQAAGTTNPSGETSLSVAAYKSAYNSYLSARTSLGNGTSYYADDATLASYAVTYTGPMFEWFTEDGALAGTIGLALKWSASTITGALDYTIYKTVSLASDRIMTSAEIDYGNGISQSATYLELSGRISGLISDLVLTSGSVTMSHDPDTSHGYPAPNFKVAAVPGPIAAAGLPGLIVIGALAAGLARRRAGRAA